MEFERKTGYLAQVGVCEDLSAPLGLISGAEEEEEDGADAGADAGAEPRSAPLRTAGPHRRKASVSLLGHSHHWLMCKQTPEGWEPSPCVFKADCSPPCPPRADQRVWRIAGTVVTDALLCVADRRERGGAVRGQMIRARCSPHWCSAIPSLSRAAVHTLPTTGSILSPAFSEEAHLCCHLLNS